MGKILELLDKHVRLDELPDDHPQREHFHAVVGDGEKHEKFRALLRKAGMNEDDIAEAMRLATGGGNATDRLPLAATRGGMGGRAADARLAFDAMFPEAARITVERRGTTVTAGRPAKGQLTASRKSFRAPPGSASVRSERGDDHEARRRSGARVRPCGGCPPGRPSGGSRRGPREPGTSSARPRRPRRRWRNWPW